MQGAGHRKIRKKDKKSNARIRFSKLKKIPDSGIIHSFYDLIRRILRTAGRSFGNLRYARIFVPRSKPTVCKRMLYRFPGGTNPKFKGMEFIGILRPLPPEIP